MTTPQHHLNPNRSRRRGARALAATAVLGLAGTGLVACSSDGDTAADRMPADNAPAEGMPMEPTTTMGGAAVRGATMGTSFGPGCAAVPADGAGSFAGMAQDPAATAASNNPVLSTLVTAVGAADLVDTLNGPGPFTIFAPTNDAFAALPPGTLDAVLADQELLTQILTYHVVGGQQLDAAALGAAGTQTTVEGSTVELSADGTTVNGADVVCSNVTTANATVHIIDEVLLPPAVVAAMSGGSTTTAPGR